MTNVLWQLSVIPMQTRVTDQPAFLIHRRDWQNSSLLLDLLTLDYGRVSLLAKGGKNSRSPGLFQPFCKISVSWSGRHELKTLTAIEGVSVEVAESLYLSLLYINEIIEAFIPRFEANGEIFSLYEGLLATIKPGNCEISLRDFERSAMQVLGYLPDMSLDAEQGRPIDDASCYQFLANRGFVPCQYEEANAIEGRYINLWNRADYREPQVAHMAKTIMRCIIDFNLQGKQLKSRDIYLQMKNWA